MARQARNVQSSKYVRTVSTFNRKGAIRIASASTMDLKETHTLFWKRGQFYLTTKRGDHQWLTRNEAMTLFVRFMAEYHEAECRRADLLLHASEQESEIEVAE